LNYKSKIKALLIVVVAKIKYTMLYGVFKLFVNIIILCNNLRCCKKQSKKQCSTSAGFKRANSLNNGISFSWLEQTWNKGPVKAGAIKDADFELLLKKLGFRSIRLPVAFTYFELEHVSTAEILEYIDKWLSKAIDTDLN
jgi:endoglucanase